MSPLQEGPASNGSAAPPLLTMPDRGLPQSGSAGVRGEVTKEMKGDQMVDLKGAKEWLGMTLVCPRPPTPGHNYKPNDCPKCYEDWVIRIQADAMRAAAAARVMMSCPCGQLIREKADELEKSQ